MPRARLATVPGRVNVRGLAMKRIPVAVAAGLALAAPGARACSSCGCTLNSDWASQGYTTRAGLNLDLRYDYFDQSELRSGTHAADRAGLALPNDQ
jgi:hypothetical protein